MLILDLPCGILGSKTSRGQYLHSSRGVVEGNKRGTDSMRKEVNAIQSANHGELSLDILPQIEPIHSDMNLGV